MLATVFVAPTLAHLLPATAAVEMFVPIEVKSKVKTRLTETLRI